MDSGELWEEEVPEEGAAAIDAVIEAWLRGEDVTDDDAWNQWEQTYAVDTYEREDADDDDSELE